MTLHPTVKSVTDRIIERSAPTRADYLERMRIAQGKGPARAHLSCSGQAHAYAASGEDKDALAQTSAGNLGIVTTYNDMLSAHQPFETYPEQIKAAVRSIGGTAQVAGGVPAMCDGVTQGEAGMELSLFSRDVIALAASVALSHNTFDAAVFLGVCDKIVPGLVIAAQAFGHLPAVFLPAGPMQSGLANDEKAKVRQRFAAGEVGRDALMAAEMAAYHGPGTCTFYGTANTNQMLMEFMGLHLPGASFVTPNTPLREALTVHGAKQALLLSALGENYTPVCDILDERAFVNGIVGLNATGGSTNLLIHLVAMAKAGGIILDWQDFSELSDITPLMARVYPNGLADVNHFHAAGGLGYMVGELLRAGLLHPDTKTVAGTGLAHYTRDPKLLDGELSWQDGPETSLNPGILRPVAEAFAPTGGLRRLTGNLGTAVMKVSAVAPEHQIVEAPVRVFADQDSVKAAFKAGELTGDVIVVVRFQGPKANGMPELHSLTPLLSILQGRGQKVALVTDGRMSGASGKVPAAIHVCPEALDGGPIAKLQDGDVLRVDAVAGTLQILTEGVAERPAAAADLSGNQAGTGRELFAMFRNTVGGADSGATIFGG
ncbi:phosphogluconate dehydratase [Sulfitobacter mediterraneus]|uniref:phosphogluconate dehydratase n=1 Tax=Sulfitobacter mediterraneus TaxID=83219 RepID=UPI001931F348|nr:phosphogluconate dehydratase [Sulfitobacter mediterraneus]MBM1631535.1 phosphogluconate dehydratase [Sulfitobacter mediterraneus]MBM1639350.1 phosphogluconate dehydratase [Sulfitobacter mediterraneus]MBM1643399.1 phosphogluconate dehydratase [Sulfitobacter mediterraneus]MBM1647445.1 phosphogluconate dehydratase [Sulfitobacter mediterraneus]MBM1651490.1 phosphogluconate dehydratase [Sulfitobacter mediterraneus]